MARWRRISVGKAERLLGHRVDRRRAYAADGKRVEQMIVCTMSCSGCFESGEYGGLAQYYPWDEKAGCHVGAGCRECGHTGKRRHRDWVPYIREAA